jgi:Ca2+-binding EF-hand superfamily protein
LKNIATKRAERALANKAEELQRVAKEVAEAKEAQAAKLKEAEAKREAAEKKRKEAELLEQAYLANKQSQDAALAVKEASSREATLKEVAQRTRLAADAALGTDSEDPADQSANAAEEDARRASIATRDAIEKSIAITDVNAEASDLLKSKMATIESAEWTVARVFALFDVDGDGNLDRDEIKAAITAISESVPSDVQLAQAFEKYDANNDGTFQREELEAMLSDELLQRKRKGSVFGRKNKDIDIEEKFTVQQVKEDLVAKELVLMIGKEKEEVESMAETVNKTLTDHEEKLTEVLTKAKSLEEQVARQEKVVGSIKVGEWSNERVFAAFDADNNDNLDVSELKLALTALLEKEVSNSDAAKLVKKYDVDGDGLLNFDEFCACAKTAEASLNNFFSQMFSDVSASEEATREARAAVAEMEGKAD